MIRRLAISISALLLVSACATTEGPPSHERAEFRAADFSWSTASGRGRVDGQLVFRSGGKPYSANCALARMRSAFGWSALTPSERFAREAACSYLWAISSRSASAVQKI